jgi:hypothetical protein
MHGVAAQAIVHHESALIVIGIEKDLRIARTVRSRLPVCILLAMAFGATLLDLQDIVGFQADLLRNIAMQVLRQLPQILEVKSGIKGQDISMTLRARNIAMR